VLVNIRRDQWRKEAVRKRHQSEPPDTPGRYDNPEREYLIRTMVGEHSTTCRHAAGLSS